MTKIKSYPDINQCKILAEILPLESADMYYFTIICDYPYSQRKIKTTAKIMDGSFSSNYDTPCWSLAALLEIIANAAAHIDEDGYLDATVCKDVHCVSLINCNGELYKADNLVDACYEMIIKLNELKML